MSAGLYSGVSGLALGIGLYRGVNGLWGGASGLIDGFGGGGPFPNASLQLDLLSGPLDSRVTFLRGSNATLIDSTGQIAYAPANLLLRSEEFNDAAWVKANSTVTANATTSPDGTVDADKLVENAGTGGKTITQTVSITGSTVYTMTAYLKAGERSWAILEFGGAFGSGYAWFNLATGVVGTSVGLTTASVTPAGNGWYRCSIVKTSSSTAAGFANIWCTNADNVTSYTGDGTSGIFIWGAQLEPVTYQTVPGPYVATTSAAYYGPRFDHFPDTVLPRGLLLEGARTNILLNSLINGTALATQSVTVTAQPYTLSFYGSGQIVLSGTASATVVGSGAYPNRRTITFTPTAGTLTLTVTGTVQYAQLEAGSWVSSFIPTGAAAATRNADSASMVGMNFSSWYTNLTGAFVVGAETSFSTTAQTPSILMVTDDLGINYQTLYVDGTTRDIGYTGWYSDFSLDFIGQSYSAVDLPARQYDLDSSYAYPSFVYGQAAAYSTDDFANSGNGLAPSLDTSGIVPVYMAQMSLGPNDGTQGYGGWFGWLRSVTYYRSRLPDDSLQTLSNSASASPASLELNFLQQLYYAGSVPWVTPSSLTTDFINQVYMAG